MPENTEFKAWSNHWLIVRPTVLLTPSIDRGIVALESFFDAAQYHGYVSSGRRSMEQQLDLIRQYAQLKGVVHQFPSILAAQLRKKIWYNTVSVYEWQPAWSRLLEIGVIINPPLAAAALFDYIRDGVNKKGQIIGASPHFAGHAFDIGGGPDGIDDELRIVTKAMPDIQALTHIVVERENNCLHVDCEPAI